MTDPEARHVLIESLAFENANFEGKKILESLKVRSAPMNEWILHTINVETFDYSTEAWVGEAIFNGMRRHQNTKCFNCDRTGHLRRDYRQGISRNNASSGNVKNRRTHLSGIYM